VHVLVAGVACGGVVHGAPVGAAFGAEPVPQVRGTNVRSAALATVTGRLEVHEGISSPRLPAPRRLFVLLPQTYDSKQRYHVVYALDGQDLFDAATASGGEEWALDEFLAAHPPGLPDLIVVGIEAGADAGREYAPPGSADGARGDAFLELLVDVIEPFVKAHYSTVPNAGGACVLGAGGGALMALYAAWMRPDRFASAVAIDLPDPGDWSPVASRSAAPGAAAAGKSSAAPRSKPKTMARPHLWIDQSSSDAAERPSAAQLLAELETGAVVQYALAGPRSTRIGRVAAGLRAVLVP
jgi:hypothetical protein